LVERLAANEPRTYTCAGPIFPFLAN
jgi:hypothetical protein